MLTATVLGTYKNQEYGARLNLMDGTMLLDMDGQVYASPTAAAMQIKFVKSKKRICTNGLDFWRLNGEPIKPIIDEIKKRRGKKMKLKNKNPGGRPKRFDGEFGTVSIQLPHDLVERFEAAAQALGM